METELVARSTDPLELDEDAARTTLATVRSLGHTYVELRRAGKRIFFFCVICLISCDSNADLREHLDDSLHAEYIQLAQATLFGRDPWPFSDGMLFFDGGNDGGNGVKRSRCRRIRIGGDKDLSVSLIGTGQVGTRVEQIENKLSRFRRIWCTWLGQDGLMATPKCGFAVVTFKYTQDLGRRHWSSDSEDSGDSGQGLPLSESRRALRRRMQLAVEKTCALCAHDLIPGGDVGTLLNCKTWNLTCSSRNTNSAFHLFHVSCLIHWILLCEFELRTDHLGYVKRRGPNKKNAVNKPITSVFCPECHGTGTHELEEPTITLNEVFEYTLKAVEAHAAYMKDPEDLDKCSTGLLFPPESDTVCEQKVVPDKLLLRFYGVKESKMDRF